VFTQSL